MIDLGLMRNCLNCSYFTLMLNTVKQGSTGKLLATAKVEIKPLLPPKKCLLLVSLSEVALCSICQNIHAACCLPSGFIHQLLFLSMVCWCLKSLYTFSFPNQLLHHFSRTNSFLSLPLFPSSLGLCSSKQTYWNFVIKVLVWSHQITLLLTDPCAAQYIKKKQKNWTTHVFRPPLNKMQQ